MLDDRKVDVLGALVAEHIRTGEPVSSRAVLAASGLAVSPATVRNDLAALERDGYVVQPHTSAGRVPTAKAYRYYVDHVSPQKLQHATRTRIEGFYQSVHAGLAELLKSTSTLLAEISHYPAVVVGPGLAGETVRGVHVVPIGADVALVVLVTDAGRVCQEVARLPGTTDGRSIDEAQNVLERVLVNQPIGSVSPDIERMAVDQPAQVLDVVRTVLDAVSRTETSSRDVYMGGTSQLASLWEDLTKVHRVLAILERETMVLGLLSGGEEGTTIKIGAELPLGEQVDMAVVSTPYEVAGRTAGRVGLLGPMRMDYRRAISIVEEVGEGLAESLGARAESSESGPDQGGH